MKSRSRLLVLSGIVIIAAILRSWASTDNFWIDEVSTYYLTMKIKSPMEAITRIRIDHHILNTAFMRLIGDTSNWFLYRLLSLITGILLIPLLYKAGARGEKKGNLLPPMLACISFPLITFSSEARGYAPAILFSLASYLILRHGWKQRLLIYRLVFWLMMGCALLAHITSLYVLAGMTAWSAYRIYCAYIKDRTQLKAEIIDFVITYVPPYATMLSIYFLIMRQSTSVGGNILPPGRVLMDTLTCFAGLPFSGLWPVFGSIFTIVLLTASGIHSLRTNRGLGIFYITSIVIAPGLTLIAYEREYLYVRYFILCFPFAILMLSDFLAHLLKSKKTIKISIVVLAIYSVGQSLHTARFLQYGRGGYMTALQEIASGPDKEPVIISGDHNFRVGMMTVYYSRYFKGIKYMRYVPSPDLPPSGADWYITHQMDKTNAPSAVVLGSWLYNLTATYPYYGLSGMTWNLYKRTGPYNSTPLLNPDTGASLKH